jgi:hypothetical protein
LLKNSSVLLRQGNLADNYGSVALRRGNLADDYGSVALRRGNLADDYGSVAIRRGNLADNYSSVAIRRFFEPIFSLKFELNSNISDLLTLKLFILYENFKFCIESVTSRRTFSISNFFKEPAAYIQLADHETGDGVHQFSAIGRQ